MELNVLNFQVFYPAKESPVYYYWQIFNNSSKSSIHTVLPSPYFQLVFPLDNSIRIQQVEKPVAKPFLCPLLESGKSIVLPANASVFGIHFHPAYSHNFLKIHPAQLYRNANLLEDISPTALFQLISGIIYKNVNFLSRIELFERILKSRLQEADSLVLYMAQSIKSNPGIKLSHLYKEMGCSTRWIQKKFKNKMGSSPHELVAVMRFNLLLKNMHVHRSHSLTQLALMSGYFDQAHSIHEFRKFTGITPRSFIKSLPPLTEVLNRY